MDEGENPFESRNSNRTTLSLPTDLRQTSAPSRLLPWICGRQSKHRQRDEGTPCPDPSGHGPQHLPEAAPQDCLPSCGMSGPCLPGLRAEGVSGLPC